MNDGAQSRTDSDRDARRRALELALRMLGARERTEAELRAGLARRGCVQVVIDDVTTALRAERLIDDAGYARRFAEDRRLLDRWGNERIARDLERRGIDRVLIEEALAGHEHEEELSRAIELLDRRFPLPFEGDRERDKAWRMLVRRGYEPELAYSAVHRHEQP
jgi:regulatory protein